jgi:hypothetical protein
LYYILAELTLINIVYYFGGCTGNTNLAITLYCRTETMWCGLYRFLYFHPQKDTTIERRELNDHEKGETTPSDVKHMYARSPVYL